MKKAEETPPGQPLEGADDQREPPARHHGPAQRAARHVSRTADDRQFLDFASGRKDAKTHGLAEDASKKLQGTVWIDEADRQVAHLEVSFIDNFHVVGGLFANIQKGSNFHFDQEADQWRILWLPTGGEGTIQARVLLLAKRTCASM